jgi:hypothetical protein
MATVMFVAGTIFDTRPARTLKAGVAVMLERTRDELAEIQQLWPRFEDLVGLRGRRMYAMRPASGSIPPCWRVAGICAPGSPASRQGCMSASAPQCRH